MGWLILLAVYTLLALIVVLGQNYYEEEGLNISRKELEEFLKRHKL